MKTIEQIIKEKRPDALLKIDELLEKHGESFEETLIKSNIFEENELLDVFSEFYELPCIKFLFTAPNSMVSVPPSIATATRTSSSVNPFPSFLGDINFIVQLLICFIALPGYFLF